VYAQDNEISWIDWDQARLQDVQTCFTASLTKLRADHPIFRRRRFFTGAATGDGQLPDIVWLRRDGEPMTGSDWASAGTGTVVVFLNGCDIPELDALGEHITDDSFLLLFNSSGYEQEFTLPGDEYGQMWETVVDTADPLLATSAGRRGIVKAHGSVQITAHTVLVLRCRY
jgi:isoamylase